MIGGRETTNMSTKGSITDGSRVQRLIDRYYQRRPVLDGYTSHIRLSGGGLRMWATGTASRTNAAGGSLHVVTDDGNYADHQVQSCEESASRRGDYTAARIARLILLLSITQRRRWAHPSWY
jgi:hypothetical protein